MGWLVNDDPLFVLPTVAVRLGLNESIFLQQLHYWLGKSTHTYDGHVWVYNTYEGWQKQFPFWSESTIRRTIVRLEKKASSYQGIAPSLIKRNGIALIMMC
ncbi:hypothetical protein LR68_02793 [Anoxybacillus sp. BCO1]|nr:hypothetical protein LR68_02793 [Anoxybacillus sp. BCO1]